MAGIHGNSLCKAVWCLLLSRSSCLTLCAPVPRQAPLSMGILQVRILEWVATPSSRGSSWPQRSNPEMECRSCAVQADALHLSHHRGALKSVNLAKVLKPVRTLLCVSSCVPSQVPVHSRCSISFQWLRKKMYLDIFTRLPFCLGCRKVTLFSRTCESNLSVYLLPLKYCLAFYSRLQ